MTDKPVISPEACKEILEALGKEDLLYSHHANVHVRHFAYERMAELINNEMAAVYQYRKCEKRSANYNAINNIPLHGHLCNPCFELLSDEEKQNYTYIPLTAFFFVSKDSGSL